MSDVSGGGGSVVRRSSVAQRVTRVAGSGRHSSMRSTIRSRSTKQSRQMSKMGPHKSRATEMIVGAGFNIVKPGVCT